MKIVMDVVPVVKMKSSFFNYLHPEVSTKEWLKFLRSADDYACYSAYS
jgi:hypothetical protein